MFCCSIVKKVATWILSISMMGGAVVAKIPTSLFAKSHSQHIEKVQELFDDIRIAYPEHVARSERIVESAFNSVSQAKAWLAREVIEPTAIVSLRVAALLFLTRYVLHVEMDPSHYFYIALGMQKLSKLWKSKD